jgi:hypothetical protein
MDMPQTNAARRHITHLRQECDVLATSVSLGMRCSLLHNTVSIGVHRRASAVEFLAGIAPVSFADTGKGLTADARRCTPMHADDS